MRQRSAWRNWLEYGVARGLLAILAALPLRWATALGCGLFRILRWFTPRLEYAARRNFEMALPGLPPSEREAMLAGVYRSLARALAVFAKMLGIRKDTVSRWIRYEGLEHYQAAKAQGRGVLFLTAHLGNWELSAYAHALLSEPMSVIVRPLDNPYLDRLINRRRTASGNRVIGREDFARSILRALQRNEAVGILLDQNVAEGLGVFVDFFGIPAATNPTFARIAAKSGAAVIPGFAVWCAAENRYVLRFYPPVPVTGDAQADTARFQQAVEAAIREYPDQWLWLHRRWKTRPPGAAPLY